MYGGTGISEQIAELKRGCEMIVCTPGRMIDMLAANNGGYICNKVALFFSAACAYVGLFSFSDSDCVHLQCLCICIDLKYKTDIFYDMSLFTCHVIVLNLFDHELYFLIAIR